MRAAARGLGLAALVFAAAVFAAAALFLARPELLLTDRFVAAAVKRFGGAYSPRWSSFSFSAVALGPRRHRYALRTQGFCASDPDGLFEACFKRLDAAVVVRYTSRGPKIEVVEELTALGERAAADLRRRRKPARPAAFPFALRGTVVRSLRVELPALVVRSTGPEAAGGLSASVTPRKARRAAFAADFKIRGARYKGGFTADTDLFDGGSPTFVDAAGRAEFGPRRARASVRVFRGADRYVVSGGASVLASTGPLREARLADCRGSGSASSGELVCRFEAVPSTPAGARYGAPKRVSGGVRLSGRARDGRYSAVVKADVDPISAWYELEGGAQVRLEGLLARSPGAMKLSHEARATLKVPRFEDLVELLRETKYAVPAPVHILKGPLELSLDSRGDPRSERQSVGYVLMTDLKGTRQRLITRAKGRVTAARFRGPKPAFEHAGELVLKEVALELPRLQIGPPPKITLDRRIQTGGMEMNAFASTAPLAGAPPDIRSRVAVRTEKPLILFSNMAKDPVPAALDLVVTYPPAAVAGVAAVRRFDVELFRRRATIDHFNVALSSASAVGALEGLVIYRTPDVLVNIKVLGTTERPRVEFESVPPLKRSDIIALLIFGKSPKELDPEESASVSNTETALESRAFGLASLYLFGATPIEHVGYDSATKTTSVKLRLPGGARLTLGSDFDQSRQLSVRKPLAPHWAIQSEITDQGQQSKAATTFLEWFNRY